MLETQKSADTFSLLCFGSLKKARRGALYRKSMAIGMRSYRRFSRWCDAGVFQTLHEHFHDAGDISGILIDSTIVRAHASASGLPKKRRTRSTSTRARGGFTTKLNLSLSDACIPLRFILIAGHRNDITQAPALLEGYSYEYVRGDKSYDSDAFIAEITSQDAIAVIPSRKGRTGSPVSMRKRCINAGT